MEGDYSGISDRENNIYYLAIWRLVYQLLVKNDSLRMGWVDASLPMHLYLVCV